MPLPTRFGAQIPCRPAYEISPKQLDVVGFLYDRARKFWAAKSIFSCWWRKQAGAPAGWRGDPKLPILAASDIIGRLGDALPSNRDVVRPDPDVS